MNPRRIGLLGGTFDPIHNGHLDLASAAQSALGLSHVLVIPANVPPHRPRPLTSSFHRFAMVALAASGRPGWRASDIELRHEAPSYTSTTLRKFHDRGYEPAELFFLVGADAFMEITTWRDYPDILDRAHFAVVSRPGSPLTYLRQTLPPVLASRVVAPAGALALEKPSIILIDAPTSDVSSTTIRARLARGEPVRGMVDDRVWQHIDQHGLYRSPTPDRRNGIVSPPPAAGRLHGQD
jgi:nicotinate-nucleotide adenylyltransferase